MGVNWNGILGGSRPLGGDNISRHAAIHHSIDGFKFRNPPEGDLRSGWSRLVNSGGPLVSFWTEEDMGELQLSQSYILAPFLGSFIFFYPVRKMSGDRPVTEIRSIISQDYDSLAIEVANERGGIAIPPPHSIGSGDSGWDVSTGLLTVESSHESGLGISTLLFQSHGLRDITGVSCGVEGAVLEECFPDVSHWILETVTNTVNKPPKRGRSPLQSMVAHGAGDPLGTLERFRSLQALWYDHLGVHQRNPVSGSIEDLFSVYEKDQGRAFQLRPTTEIKIRMLLADREGSLQLLEPDISGGDIIDLRDRCANGWMPFARDQYDGVNFPFSYSELSVLEKGPSERCFNILNECLISMGTYDEYSAKSKITMARILTKHGDQSRIEDVWKSVGPIGQEEMELMSPSILEWRDNPMIDDFWGLLIMLEGGEDVDFRRDLCQQVIYQSASEDDLKGIIRYIPDLLCSKEKIDHDWLILDRLGLDNRSIVRRINYAQPSRHKTKLRIVLSIRRFVNSGQWQLGDLIRDGLGSGPHSDLYNTKWIKPILLAIHEHKKIYPADCNYPDDAFAWISRLSADQYLECLNDEVLSRYITNHDRWPSPRPSSSWPLPKAMPVDYQSSHAYLLSEFEAEWARLVAKPKWNERFSYQMDVITKLYSNLSFVCLVICLLSPIAITANFENDLGQFGGYSGFILSVSFLGLGFFVDKILRRRSIPERHPVESILEYLGTLLFIAIAGIVMTILGASISVGMDFDYQEFGGFQIPIPNNPLISGILVVVFWQVWVTLNEKSNLASQKKTHFLGLFEG